MKTAPQPHADNERPGRTIPMHHDQPLPERAPHPGTKQEDNDPDETLDVQDPLVRVREQFGQWYDAVRDHVSILIDDAQEKLFGTLVLAACGVLAGAWMIAMCVIASYYVVTGVIAGLEAATLPMWLASLAGGLLCIVVPLVVILISLAVIKARRAKHYARKYRHLLDEGRRS